MKNLHSLYAYQVLVFVLGSELGLMFYESEDTWAPMKDVEGLVDMARERGNADCLVWWRPVGETDEISGPCTSQLSRNGSEHTEQPTLTS